MPDDPARQVQISEKSTETDRPSHFDAVVLWSIMQCTQLMMILTLQTEEVNVVKYHVFIQRQVRKTRTGYPACQQGPARAGSVAKTLDGN
jgi:hypothetical protein